MSDESDDLPSGDAGLFRAAMKNVRPLVSDTHVVRKAPPPPLPVQSRRDDREVINEMREAKFDFEELEYGDEVTFQRTTVSRAVMRKLRRGQFAVQAEFDLHGLAVADAKSQLAEFVRRCGDHDMTCVRVIHGKGHRSPGKMPVLKPKVARWLSQWEAVVAFTSARPVDGGTGALYVLLKQH